MRGARVLTSLILLVGDLAQGAPQDRGGAPRHLDTGVRCPFPGVQFMLRVSSLPLGWTLSYQAPYSAATTLEDISPSTGESQQPGDYDCLLLGAKKSAADVPLQVAAIGSRLLFETTSHFWDNDVYWYSVNGSSAGFSGSSDLLLRPGDRAPYNGATRLSWHIGNGRGGYRAGRQENLDWNNTWQKVVMHGPQGVFCEERVCGPDEVLRFQLLLSHCSGRSCTPAECCEKRGLCRGFQCPSNYFPRLTMPDMCTNATCQTSECCTPAPHCPSTLQCPTNQIPKVHGHLVVCSSRECNVAECCEAAPLCTTGACAAGQVLRRPIPLCRTANCSSDVCCRAAGRCDAAVCQDTTLSLRKSTLPPFCEEAECRVHECCELEPPKGSIQWATLNDVDLDDGFLGGNITWAAPPADIVATHFEVHLCTLPHEPNGCSALGRVARGANLFALPAQTPFAPWLVVGTCNEAGCNASRPFAVRDASLNVAGVAFEDFDLDAGEVGGALEWTDLWSNQSSAEALVCDGEGRSLGVRSGTTTVPAAFFINNAWLLQDTVEDAVFVAVLDHDFLLAGEVQVFPIGGGSSESAALEQFLLDILHGTTVLLACSGSAVLGLRGGARAVISMFGAEHLGSLQEAVSFVLIGTKGASWRAVESWAAAGSGVQAVAELSCPIAHLAVYTARADGMQTRYLGAAAPGKYKFLVPDSTPFEENGTFALRISSWLAEQVRAVPLWNASDVAAVVEHATFTPSVDPPDALELSGDVTWQVTPGVAPVLAYRVYLTGDKGDSMQLGADIVADWRHVYALRVPPGTPRGNFSEIAIFALSRLALQSKPSAELPVGPHPGMLALQIAVVATASALGAARVVSAVQAVEAAGKMAVETDLQGLERCATRMETLKPQPVTITGTFTSSVGDSVTISGVGEPPYFREFVSPFLPGCMHHHHKTVMLRQSGSLESIPLHRHKACENVWHGATWVLKKISNSAIILQGSNQERLLLYRRPPRYSCVRGRVRTILRLYAPLLVLAGVSAVVLGLEYWAFGAMLLGVAVFCSLIVVVASRCTCIMRFQRFVHSIPPAAIRAPFWRCLEMLVGLMPCVPAFMAGTLLGWITGFLVVLGALAKARDADLLASLLELVGGACVAVMCFLVRLGAEGVNSSSSTFGGEEALLAVTLTAGLLCVKGVDDWMASIWALYLTYTLPHDRLMVSAERTAEATGLGVSDALVLEAFALGSVEDYMQGRLSAAFQKAAIEVSRHGKGVASLVLEELFSHGSGWLRVTGGLRKHLSGIIDTAEGLAAAEAVTHGFVDEFARAVIRKQLQESLSGLETSLKQLLTGPLGVKTLLHSRDSAAAIVNAVSRLEVHADAVEGCLGLHTVAGHLARAEFLAVLAARVGFIAEEVSEEIKNSHLSSVDLCMAKQRLAELCDLAAHMTKTLRLFEGEDCIGYEGIVKDAVAQVRHLTDILHTAVDQLKQMPPHAEPRQRVPILQSLDTVAVIVEALLESQRRLSCLIPKSVEVEQQQRLDAVDDLKQRAPPAISQRKQQLQAAVDVLYLARTSVGLAKELAQELSMAAKALESVSTLLDAARGEAVEVLDAVVAASTRSAELSTGDVQHLRQKTTAFATARPVRALILLQGLSSEALQNTYRSLNRQLEVQLTASIGLPWKEAWATTACQDLSQWAFRPTSQAGSQQTQSGFPSRATSPDKQSLASIRHTR